MGHGSPSKPIFLIPDEIRHVYLYVDGAYRTSASRIEDLRHIAAAVSNLTLDRITLNHVSHLCAATVNAHLQQISPHQLNHPMVIDCTTLAAHAYAKHLEGRFNGSEQRQYRIMMIGKFIDMLTMLITTHDSTTSTLELGVADPDILPLADNNPIKLMTDRILRQVAHRQSPAAGRMP